MPHSKKIEDKLQALPDKPGIYIMRDRRGKIIYVGKATSLRDRIRSYFRQSTLRSADPKTRSLVNTVEDFETLVCRTEAEATLTEGRLIKDYRPRFNVLLKDDKRFLLLRVNRREALPRFDAVRLQKEDGADYFGPYVSSAAAWAALEFVERRFALRSCRPPEPGPDDHKHCLKDVLRHCSAPCINKVTPEQYREKVDGACAFLRGEKPEILKEIEAAMTKEAAAHKFEKAAALRDSLLLLRRAIKERALSTRTLAMKAEDAAAGVAELQQVLGMIKPPRVIEAYDISNIAGTLAVGSLVCAVAGMPQKQRYRRFRIRTVEGSDDPAMMAEMIRRRFARLIAERGERPDLVLVDGGLTQLRAARRELDGLGLRDLPVAGLAKKFEEIYYEGALSGQLSAVSRDPIIRLPENSRALHVLQRIRDEAHRFALDYHRALRRRRIMESQLDDIEGIGTKRKEDLLKHFGSIARLRRASVEEIAAAPGVGPELARLIHKVLATTTAEPHPEGEEHAPDQD
ncbi:MAG: excinuclease ABC subunit UvrC [Verrucomicrobia bacterium]|nr:MAG: excinuclease ABC subunit UvrC [Verrucomicrobiota bacterium]